MLKKTYNWKSILAINILIFFTGGKGKIPFHEHEEKITAVLHIFFIYIGIHIVHVCYKYKIKMDKKS